MIYFLKGLLWVHLLLLNFLKINDMKKFENLVFVFKYMYDFFGVAPKLLLYSFAVLPKIILLHF